MKPRNIIATGLLIITGLLFAKGTVIISDMNNKVKPETDKNEYKTESKEKEYLINKPGQSSILSEKPVNLLLMGLDDAEERADVLMFFNYNPSKGDINVLSIARDTKVYQNGKAVKINSFYYVGKEKHMIREVSKITGLSVHYYVTLNFKGFREIIDALGGVNIYVPMDMNYDDPLQGLHIHLKKGWQVLDGDKSEQFVRFRKGNNKGEGYNNGDIGRIEIQQAFIKAFLNQKLKLKYVLRAREIYNILQNHMKTNINIQDILKYVNEFKQTKLNEVQFYTLPGDVILENNVWYLDNYKKKTRELIEKNFYH